MTGNPAHQITEHLTIDDLYDLDPLRKVVNYLDARDRVGVVHRNVDVIYEDDLDGNEVRWAITTADLRRMVDEVTTLRREVLMLESDCEELESLLDNDYEDDDD